MSDATAARPAIHRVDGWSRAVEDRLAVLDPSAVARLLAHLAKARGSAPGAHWLTACDELLTGDGCDVLHVLLGSLLDARPVRDVDDHHGLGLVLDACNTDLVRAAAWATLGVPQLWVVPRLHGITERVIREEWAIGWMSCGKVANACVLALGRLATRDAVTALHQLAGIARDNGLRKRIAAALEVAGAAHGLTAGQVVERALPTGGLDASGEVRLRSGRVDVRATLDDEARLHLDWWGAGESRTKPPADMPADVNALKRAVAEVRAVVAGERRRVEALFATDCSWAYDEWACCYRTHPVTARLARRLVWTFETGASVVSGVPDGDVLRTLDGDVPMPERGSVSLWHPAMASTDDVGSWRAWVFERGLRQPFKQAFREVYALTPAERQTATYSTRFAAHVVRYQQLFALCKQRGWVTNYLGLHEGGIDGCARRVFREAGLTAAFDHGLVEQPDTGSRVYLSATDRVWFYRTKDRSRARVALGDVPPRVFSEAMRDVDLFVSATSIAIDPEWADRGDDVGAQYWRRAHSGPLSEFAQVRRDALARILPTLKVADRLELEDRFVLVRGRRGSYKVHIGSGSVFAAPDDRFICIVARRLRAAPMLPFEGDELLSVVISKALLLASDDRITDATILQQLGVRR